MTDRVLFVHAHPDDETIVTGGSIATFVDDGVAVTVLTCTRGEKGEVIPADIAHLEGDDDALAAHREREAALAMKALGVVDHRYLGTPDARASGLAPRRYRDSGMRWGPHGPLPLETTATDALCAADPAEVAADIEAVVRDTGATAVISYDEDGGYGHPDHVAVHVAALRAAASAGVPFLAIKTGAAPAAGSATSGESAGTHRPRITLDATPVLDRKLDALRAYRSQLTVDGDVLRMPGGQVEPISVVEQFERMDPVSTLRASADSVRRGQALDREPEAPSGEWAELGTVARVFACVSAVVLGAAAAAVGTVSHHVAPDVLGVAVPTGLVLALVMVAALLAGLRLAFDSRIVAAVAAVSFLAVVNVLSVRSRGGSVLIDDSTLSYWWVYAPVALAFVVLGWPRLPPRGRGRLDAVSDPKGTLPP